MIVIKTEKDLLEKISLYDKKLYIAGAGHYGGILGDYLNFNKINWCGFVDVKGEGELCNKRIYPYEKLQTVNYDCVIISSVSLVSEIYSTLKYNSVDENKIARLESSGILVDAFLKINSSIDVATQIGKYRNCHAGKRGFVIGNGPSLKLDDLEKLKNEITYASNSIYALYNHTSWRPTYYGTCDFRTLKRMLEKTVNDNYGNRIFTEVNYHNYIYKNFHNRINDICYLKIVNYMHENEKYVDFSDDAANCVYVGATITYVLIQLAVYMGLSEIYLLGVDYSFSAERNAKGEIVKKNVINHNELIEEEDKNMYYNYISLTTGGLDYIAAIDHQLWGYQAAKKYTDNHGIKIYNATRGGNLEVFERVDFDSLF